MINFLRRGKPFLNKKFHKGEFRESTGNLENPGCGWYHIYTFHVEQPLESFWIQCREEELVLLLIDIGAFQKTELPQSSLDYIASILSFFQGENKGMILRFVYDTEGKGMLREPETGKLVCTHMRQVGRTILPFMDHILALQGIFVGNWGEMHGSRFLSEKWLAALAGTMLETVEYRCALAVRTPAQWRTIAAGSTEKVKKHLALFNDGIFGSDTDLGTYGSIRREAAREKESWCREDELAWQKVQLSKQLNGGEILGIRDAEDAAEDLAKMHISYLNSVYQKEGLDAWKEQKVSWAGETVSGYDYIGRHLGYRFVVRAAEFRKKRLEITVENCGFASLLEEAQCRLIIENIRGEERVLYPETDPKMWKSRARTVFSVEIRPEEGDRCFLQLRRKRDGRILSFGNKDGKQKVLLGQFGNFG